MESGHEYLQLDRNLIGPFTKLLDDILLNQIDKFDNTTHTPEKQVKGKFPITHVPVKTFDRYNGQKDAEFKKFIKDIEALETEYEAKQTPPVRMKIVFSLVAQMDYSIIAWAQTWVRRAAVVFPGEIGKELETLNNRLAVLRQKLDARNRHIVVEADHGKSFIEQRGSIAYLAVVSHGVSHQKLYPKAKAKLDTAIESLPIPGAVKPSTKKLTLTATT